MRMKSADRRTEPTARELPFMNGDRLDQPTFHALYDQCPPGVKAELIGGMVYIMPSPVSLNHGDPHSRIVQWLANYAEETDGVRSVVDTSNILGPESEPQPDAALFVLPEYGGRVTVDGDGMVQGPCELVAEVAHSSVAIDLHRKRDDYTAAGVREYIVIVTRGSQVIRFARRGTRLVEKGPDDDGVIRSTVFPGLWLDPAGMFAPNTRRITATLRDGLSTPEHAAFVAKLEAKRAALARRKPKS